MAPSKSSRLPFSCDAWVNTPRSSSVQGFGVRGDDLIVRFGGAPFVYLYPNQSKHFVPLYTCRQINGSVGKYIAVNVRHLLFKKIKVAPRATSKKEA